MRLLFVSFVIRCSPGLSAYSGHPVLYAIFEKRFQIANDVAETTAHLLTLIQQVTVGGKQMHDANIVATMQSYGIDQQPYGF